MIQLVAYTMVPTSHSSSTTSSRFLSFTIDTSTFLTSSLDDDFLSNRHLQTLTTALATPGGAYLRVGGTLADEVVYYIKDFDDNDENKNDNSTNNNNTSSITMNQKQWAQLLEFCHATNVTLIFTLNIMWGWQQQQLEY